MSTDEPDEERTDIAKLSSRASTLTVTAESSQQNGIVIEPYSSEEQLTEIISLISKDLSEPYSIYTYRYFIYSWPQLCYLAYTPDGSSGSGRVLVGWSERTRLNRKWVGSIVCKAEIHRNTTTRRGYIAMLAVHKEFRRHGIASRLVATAMKAMAADQCEEIVLEAEVTNEAALNLYEKMGFIRDKRLHRYYLNQADAFRLKLWLSAETRRQLAATVVGAAPGCVFDSLRNAQPVTVTASVN